MLCLAHWQSLRREYIHYNDSSTSSCRRQGSGNRRSSVMELWGPSVPTLWIPMDSMLYQGPCRLLCTSLHFQQQVGWWNWLALYQIYISNIVVVITTQERHGILLRQFLDRGQRALRSLGSFWTDQTFGGELTIYYIIHFTWQSSLKGAFKSDFWKNLGFCPNQVDPPPSPKLKKIDFFCILGYSKHIIFSWKSPFFWWLVIFNVIFGDF